MSSGQFAFAANDEGIYHDQHGHNYRVGVVRNSANANTQKRTRVMDEITRPELDAKLELVEARMDSRLARMEVVVERIGDDLKAITSSTSNFKYWAIGTAIAVVIGLYAANVSLLQGFVAAFESGRGVTTQQQAQPNPPAQQSPPDSKRDLKRQQP